MVDKFTGANYDCVKFGYAKRVGREAGQSTIPIQVMISGLKMIKTVLTLFFHSYFVVWSAMINILIFILIKTSVELIFISVLYRIKIKMPATNQYLRSKCIEVKYFAFMCTICARVQICTRVQINLHHLESCSKFAPRCKFARGCKFLKHRSHGQKYTLLRKFAPVVKICTWGKLRT